MSASALEEKKAVALHDMKARNLQAKINALHNIEKVSQSNNFVVLPAEILQDVRGCIEQLQTIDTEVQKLQRSQKDLAKQQNDLEGKVIEKNELLLRQQVSYSHVPLSRNSTSVAV